MVGIEVIKVLREKTGVGMMDCKVALHEAAGDIDQAVEYLRKKGLSGAAKKAGREATEGSMGSYIHVGGKVGVLIEVNCETDFVARTADFQELVRDLGLQIAGASPAPRYVGREEVDPAVIEHERSIYIAQAQETGKPEPVVAKIVAGKIEKFLQEICLMEQPFIKDPSVRIKEMVALKIAKLGENIKIRRFTRYQLGT